MGCDTAFKINVRERIVVPSKVSTDSYVADTREQKALLVPTVWLMPYSEFRKVKNREEPQLEGCWDALLVEILPLSTERTDAGLVSRSWPLLRYLIAVASSAC